jgi:ABC-type branched-subunit amino acid transport system substrate-binding protein
LAAPSRRPRPRGRQAVRAGGQRYRDQIGNTGPYSGPLSNANSIPLSMAAYFKMINEKGGINGRKINFISYDDGYSPPKTVEMTRNWSSKTVCC